eukprot:515447_1
MGNWCSLLIPDYLSSIPTAPIYANWIPNDAARHIENGLDFYIHIDTTQLPTNMNDQDDSVAINAIMNAINTWDNVPCSKNKFNFIIKDDYNNQDIGFAEYNITNGNYGKNEIIYDIIFGGFLAPHIFNNIATFGNISILAATILFDYDGHIIYPESNNKQISFAEIYFNDYFNWSVFQNENDANNGYIDIESIALHELGHVLGQMHNLIPSSNQNNVMNFQCDFIHDLHGIDIADHCKEFANWGKGVSSSSNPVQKIQKKSTDNDQQNVVNSANHYFICLTVFVVCVLCLHLF